MHFPVQCGFLLIVQHMEPRGHASDFRSEDHWLARIFGAGNAFYLPLRRELGYLAVVGEVLRCRGDEEVEDRQEREHASNFRSFPLRGFRTFRCFGVGDGVQW